MASRRTSGGNLCCLPLCRSRKHLDSNLHFHRFPSNSELSKTWLKFVNRPDLNRKTCKELNNTYKVCSRHFAPDMYMSPISPRLKHSAVPTIPVQEKVSQCGTLSVESTVAVPSPKIDTPDASSKICAIATECVEESDGPLQIFIPSTDSEKGSSRDSMAAESLDDWGYFDGGGGNDPLEVTSFSSDMPKEEANNHENTSRVFCSADFSTPEGMVIEPNTSQHQDSGVPDKLNGEIAPEFIEVKDEPLDDWRDVGDCNTQEESGDLHNDLLCSQERDAHGESVKAEPLDSWKDIDEYNDDNRLLQVKEELDGKDDDQFYRTKLMASKGKMAELAERKCGFNWKFSCDNKSERLIEAGYARIQNIMRCSGIYNDDLHISLQKKLENNANLTIDCHKSCVSSYTSTHHVKVFKKRKHSQESSSYIPPKRRRQSSACGMFDLLQDCLFCGEKCELKKDSKNPSRWRAAYKFRQILSPDRKTTLKESILEICHSESAVVSASMLVEDLINLVRERPAIYDPSDPNHWDRDVIASLWKEVAAALSCTEPECKDKWRHLRSNFMRERRKNSEKPSGSGNTQARRWVYYDAMQFLIPYVTPRPTSSNVPQPPDEDTCHETEDADQDSSLSAVIEASENASPQEAASNVETCEDRSNGKPILPKSKKPCIAKKHSKASADEMDLVFLDELKQLRGQASSQNDNDRDRQFLLSLLPMMKQLAPIDNMDIRIEIYEAFRRKMFKPAPSVQYGY